ncbi:hypothetical protein D7316_03647 [Gordonia insulae]|uniref:Enoyl-CoA hydratase n=2 Tax=Gordonia insulae TaxID=2420509 RepID=A0A3G8JS76_9ACTN|nr:hypothetical protein D7316_03647 [Gordonia insulae]
MFNRKLSALAVVVVMGAMTWLGAGTASAEPQLPRLTTAFTDNVGTLGDHDSCRGAFNVGMVTPKGKRGIVRFTLTSFGFTGDGAGWRRDPRCRFLVNISSTSGKAYARQTFFKVSFGSRKGEKVVRDIHTGSGLALLTIATFASITKARVPQGYGNTMYTVIP